MDQAPEPTNCQVQSKLRNEDFKIQALGLHLVPLRDSSVIYQRTPQLPTDIGQFISLRLPMLTRYLDPHKPMQMRTTLTSKKCFQAQAPMKI